MISDMRIAKPTTRELLVIFIFAGTLSVKMMVLHLIMQIQQHFLPVTVMSLASILIILFMVRFLSPRRPLKGYVIVHVTVTTLIFINTVYYSHFFTLVPVHSVFLIGQLGGVTDSIAALIRPVFFLYFVDTVFLWAKGYRSKWLWGGTWQEKNWMYALISLALIVGVGTSFYVLSKQTEGHLTPLNLGMLNYHFSDIVRLSRPMQVDPEEAEEAVTALTREEEVRRWKGLLEGRNIIVIQAESLQTFAMEKPLEGQVITPVLNDLLSRDTIFFSRFYEQVGWGNTSDAEFASHNSYYPSTRTFSYKAFEGNSFSTLPMLLNELGYTSMVFHGNDPDFWNRRNAYPGQGIHHFYSSEEWEMNEIIGMGLSDRELFRQSLRWLKEAEQPFYAMYITLTSHHPFVLEEELQLLNMPNEFQETLLGHYLQSIRYLDQEIGSFIQLLMQENLYENSAIIIYGDHQGLDMRNQEANELVSRFLGRPYQEDEMLRVPLIIHIPGSGVQENILTAGGQIDFYPTVANLVGSPISPNHVMGKDILNIREGFVAKQTHLSPGSFIDNDKIFIMSLDGLYHNSRAWFLESGEPVPLEDCREGYERALAEIALSEFILQNDLIENVREVGLEGILEEIRLLLHPEVTDELDD